MPLVHDHPSPSCRVLPLPVTPLAVAAVVYGSTVRQCRQCRCLPRRLHHRLPPFFIYLRGREKRKGPEPFNTVNKPDEIIIAFESLRRCFYFLRDGEAFVKDRARSLAAKAPSLAFFCRRRLPTAFSLLSRHPATRQCPAPQLAPLFLLPPRRRGVREGPGEKPRREGSFPGFLLSPPPPHRILPSLATAPPRLRDPPSPGHASPRPALPLPLLFAPLIPLPRAEPPASQLACHSACPAPLLQRRTSSRLPLPRCLRHPWPAPHPARQRHRLPSPAPFASPVSVPSRPALWVALTQRPPSPCPPASCSAAPGSRQDCDCEQSARPVCLSTTSQDFILCSLLPPCVEWA
ncbi:hypothetical protein Taro_032737 [Colocasia esculenta]|uniref:Uncharacterized protein n=1 Tax=Colocasia esculenta TaxID=4460 RepID=A0A843VVR9_COLES|nr:hypothetical protein [Colocasia esculenta]